MAHDKLRACPLCLTPVAETRLGLRDYAWVNPLLPGKVGMMDIDAVLERNGHVLMLEFKPEGAVLGMGTLLTYRTLVRMGCDVFVVRGDGDVVELGQVPTSGSVVYTKMTKAYLVAFVTDWFRETSR